MWCCITAEERQGQLGCTRPLLGTTSHHHCHYCQAVRLSYTINIVNSSVRRVQNNRTSKLDSFLCHGDIGNSLDYAIQQR